MLNLIRHVIILKASIVGRGGDILNHFHASNIDIMLVIYLQ